ncbi:kinase-like domain-containing protein [Phyllosticta paracitricarpa]|uniref:Kinase-like domain-containing protein n=1 Tax=Phyllosticta paracitricarpa TaxID=2016321 RepID=A0ABR1N7F4_9PEZI
MNESTIPLTKPPGPLSAALAPARDHDGQPEHPPSHHDPTSPAQPAAELANANRAATALLNPVGKPHSRTPSAARLSLQTDFTSTLPSNATPSIVNTLAADVPQAHGSAAMDIQQQHQQHQQQQRGLSSALSAASLGSSLSPSSAISSPALGALADITPLPSPLVGGDSPGPWRRATVSRPESRGSSGATREDCLSMLSTGTLSPSRTPSRKSKGYSGLMTAAVEAHSANMQAVEKNRSAHARHRSLSEYHPDPLHNARPRHVTISNPHGTAKEPVADDAAPQSQLHREEYLAAQRGLAAAPSAPPSNARLLPTPPPSNRSSTESEEEDLKDQDMDIGYLSIKHNTGKRKLYRPLRELGQGAFSKVILATREKIESKEPPPESQLNPKKLVAIKIVEHGPAGGADEARVEMTLKREVEVLRSISHPSLINLKAFDFDDQQALLVLNYCPGGDLYELADKNRERITPDLVQRFFAELVGAVRHLHSQCIVHRDIKLENVLLNVPVESLSTIQSPQIHPTALLTLTDLGLCRRIDLTDPMLTTRCGSEDYAAPEILLGQPYDGRATDAWALGVLLYALMEGRLPFDPPPGKGRGRSRTVHRIARCDWMWCTFGDDDGEWDPEKPETVPWTGAREVVEGLLKKVSRGRKSLDEVAEMEWVKNGLQIEGGVLRRLDEDSDSERSGSTDSTMLDAAANEAGGAAGESASDAAR